MHHECSKHGGTCRSVDVDGELKSRIELLQVNACLLSSDVGDAEAAGTGANFIASGHIIR